MKKFFVIIGCLLAGLQVSYGQAAASKQLKPRELREMAATVQQFLNVLPDSLKQKAVFPFDDEERFNWHFTPRPRKGACYKSMNQSQRQAALAIIQTVLSEKGNAKTIAIMELEIILKALENREPNDHYRDPENYYFTVFGTPGGKEPWAWRMEGHHISLNFSSVTGQLLSSTPAFLGSNPAIVPDGPQKGKQILKLEEDLARSLMQSFSAEQLKTVIIDVKAPGEIITSNKRKAILESSQGIRMAEMSLIQKKRFMELLNVYLDNFNEELAVNHMKKIRKAGLDNLRFAWAGSQERGQGHYYRIHGPTLLIEYDNTQTHANHVHTVVRDLTDDFGEDILKKHYDQQAHGK
ncbi:DUF3500 domain-containing protein [Rhodocytophaga rosea]|uniref:DUF3500 domain-containing protein n=1 Tax=Rhodocytophaga rosea TaxID=2704465 RepID=A0A6C0GSA9_9BACT|nr:DUF3500 domain-containing protein [Rhodocytophaga rosea]QHT70959.1 DUF3500 domain-containing protein [Rhodocytophaga rosea]